MSEGEPEDPARRSLLREPLLHFVLLGVAIFAAQALLADEEPEAVREPIIVTDHLRASLAEDRLRRVGQRPEGEELDALVAGYVRDEALYREALRLGLDRGDTIVRRRLVQKMEFVLQGAAEVPEPSDEELRAFLEAHADDFVAPSKVGFEHVYLSRDARGETLSADGAALMAALTDDDQAAEGAGDPFIAGQRFALSTEEEIAARMGVSFAAAVTAAPDGEWTGPFESSYGLHAVHVTSRETTRPLALDEVREIVRRAVVEEARERAAEEAVQELIAEYPTERGAP